MNPRAVARVQLHMHLRRWLLIPLATAGLVACGSQAPRQESAREPAPQELQVPTEEWKTDFSRHSVPLGEFASGGPPRDGIPPVDRPKFVGLAEAEAWLGAQEPVLAVELDGRARAYPHQILIWHEIVNDTLAGRPIAVTFCPLCNTSLVFDRRAGERTLTFGTTGNLRKSDLVMWDRQTESWWQQFSGEAVVGRLTGTKLTAIPAQTLSFEDFRTRYPEGQVLSRDTGNPRAYGRNPYEGYDDPAMQPFLLDEEADDRLEPKARVISLADGDSAVVVPFERLRKEPVVSLEAGGAPVVVFHAPGVKSALDAAEIADSRDAGTATAFDRRLGGRTLRFVPGPNADAFRDRETGSAWDITGRAVSGPLAGRRLTQVQHDVQFWFAVAAFLPDVRIAR